MKIPFNVSFDTNIVDTTCFDLSENTTIGQLAKYVKKGYIKVFLSNVVLGEIRKHFKEGATSTCSLIRKCRSDIQKGKCGEVRHGISDTFVKEIGLGYILNIPSKEVVVKSADRYLNGFIESLEVQKMTSEDINVDTILDDYFMKEPPFEDSEKKGYEFPDAIIAAQIKKYFSDDNPLFFITKDKGLQRALESMSFCIIYDSFNEFYKIINEKERYDGAFKTISDTKTELKQKIDEMLDDESYYSLEGLEYDRKGVCSGYDYDEVLYKDHCLKEVEVFSIDYFDDTKINATLNCYATVEAECSYCDYDNSFYDSEEKDFLFLNEVTMVEKHEVNFACGIEFDREKEKVLSVKFHVYLGGDTRMERVKKYDCDRIGAVCIRNDEGK